MLKPADGIEGIKEAVMTAVRDADPNACPPMVNRSGDRGTFEKCALMAKKALTRSVGSIPIFLVRKWKKNCCSVSMPPASGGSGLGGRNHGSGSSY